MEPLADYVDLEEPAPPEPQPVFAPQYATVETKSQDGESVGEDYDDVDMPADDDDSEDYDDIGWKTQISTVGYMSECRNLFIWVINWPVTMFSAYI